jgi:hypothetical protein
MHLEEHLICSSKRETPWLAEEEPWVRHLCFDPKCTFDFKLKAFSDVMSWAYEALDARPVKYRLLESWERKYIQDISQEVLMEYMSEIARITINAAREHRFFLQTAKRQLAIANARTQHDDIICQLQGCSEPVVLRKERGTGGRFRSDMYNIVGKVYMASYGCSGKLLGENTAEPETEIFEIC